MGHIKVSSDKSLLNIDMIHKFLNEAYWSKGRSRKAVVKSIEYSDCFGIFLNNEQIGFARVITDKITFAYLLDVFILEPYRGKGYSKILISKILQDPELVHVKKWMLATTDAAGLYEKFGFKPIQNTYKYMQLSVNK